MWYVIEALRWLTIFPSTVWYSSYCVYLSMEMYPRRDSMFHFYFTCEFVEWYVSQAAKAAEAEEAEEAREVYQNNMADLIWLELQVRRGQNHILLI